MESALIWLHDEALRASHPVFRKAPGGTRAIFVWDDNYLHGLGYSLKRLIFIYETLCELPVDIIRGDTSRIISGLAPSCVFIPATNKPHIISVIDNLKRIVKTEIVSDDHFAFINEPADHTRFFRFWKHAEKTALIKNGSHDERGEECLAE